MTKRLTIRSYRHYMVKEVHHWRKLIITGIIIVPVPRTAVMTSSGASQKKPKRTSISMATSLSMQKMAKKISCDMIRDYKR